MARCQDCGEHSPDQASFCIVCGARLIAPGARTRVPIPPAVGPTIRLRPADIARPTLASVRVDRAASPPAWPGIRQALVPLVGLVFGMAVVIGLAQLFALNGLSAATVWPIVVLLGGVLLAGYASKAAQAMGDPYLLPAIAAVVLGGTSILGGRGNYLGTVAGVILITLLQSILSVTQMEEFGRHVIYGVVIIAML